MSEKYTEVAGEHAGGIGIWGHVAPVEAIAKLREHYDHQITQASSALSDIDAGRVRVYHQLGPWAAKNRRLVFDGFAASPSTEGDTDGE